MDQLLKKNNLNYTKVYPKTYTEGVSDKDSGLYLDDILNTYNHYFLVYVGNKEKTRLLLPKKLRRKGMWITYTMFDNTNVTEYFIGDDIKDAAFGNDEYWKQAYNYDITVEDLELLHRLTEKFDVDLKVTDIHNNVVSDNSAIDIENNNSITINAYAYLETFGDEDTVTLSVSEYTPTLTLNGELVSTPNIHNNHILKRYDIPKFIGDLKIKFTGDYSNVKGKKNIIKSKSLTLHLNTKKYFGFGNYPTVPLGVSHFSDSVNCTVIIPAIDLGYKHIYFVVPLPMAITKVTLPDAFNAPLPIVPTGTLTDTCAGITVVYNTYKSVDAIDSSVDKRLTIS